MSVLDTRIEPATSFEVGGLVRVRLDVAYDGTDFAGWACQPDQRSVQEVLEKAIELVTQLPPPVRLTCAGRTDAGVHARGQVAHLDLPLRNWQSFDGRFASRLRAVLPVDISLMGAETAPVGFDARFSASSRRYSYRVADAGRPIDPLRRRDVLRYKRALDLDVMNAGAAQLVGQHDFSAFCRRKVGATTIRTLLAIHWSRDQEGFAVLDIRADAFCHSMVRSLVGAMLAVGDGTRSVDWLAEYLVTGIRTHRVTVARAHALVLEEVEYPVNSALADRAQLTRARRLAPSES